jgi:hypothetical protein
VKVKDQTEHSQENIKVEAKVDSITSSRLLQAIHKTLEVILNPTCLNIVIMWKEKSYKRGMISKDKARSKEKYTQS